MTNSAIYRFFGPHSVTRNDPPPPPPGDVPKTSDIHHTYSIALLLHTPSPNYDDIDATVAAVADLGVKHVRGRYTASSVATWRRLADNYGVTALARFGAIEQGSNQPTPAELVQSLVDDFGPTAARPTRKVSDYIFAIEGWNEPNNNGTPWIKATTDYTKATWEAMRNGPNARYVADIPILGPALARINSGGAEGMAPPNNRETDPTTPRVYKDGTPGDEFQQSINFAEYAESIHGQGANTGLSPWVDMGVMHIYPLGSTPSTDIDRFTSAARGTSTRSGHYPAPLKLPVTEGGYFTNMDYTGNSNVTPAWAAALYHDRHIMEHFLRGHPWFNQHELWDDVLPANPTERDIREDSFGLYYSNQTPKPGKHTIKRFLALMADDNPNTKRPVQFTTEDLPMTISPEPGPAGSTRNTLRKVLAQKSNGKWYLILWRDIDVYDQRTKSDLRPIAPLNVTVTLRNDPKRMIVWAPSKSATPVDNTTDQRQSVQIGLDGSLHVIEIG